MTESIATRPRTAMDALAPYKEQLTQTLAGRLPEVQFMRVCASLWESNQTLRECNWGTFILAMSEAAEAGLIPSNVLGECYIIPRWNGRNKRMEANFQLGYRGAMKLARRGGDVLDMIPRLVYENDEFHEIAGTKLELHHVPWYCNEAEEKGEIRLAYSVARLRDGSLSYRVIDREAIDKAAAMSGGRNQPMSHVWRDHFGEMALKTAIHRHSKFLPIPDREKAIILRDMYRADGIEGPETEPAITIEQVSEPPSDSVAKDHQERKAYDSAGPMLWNRARKFLPECGLTCDRDSPKDRQTVVRLVMWLASDGDPWPPKEQRAEQTRLMQIAIGQIDQWCEASDDERRAMCDEFRAYIDGVAVAEVMGGDGPPDWEAKAVAQFEADQAAKGGE